MPISWEYYSKRRRIQIDTWVKGMKFKSYDQFLDHLASHDILPPSAQDEKVKKCIEDLARESVEKEAKPKAKRPASLKRSKTQKKTRGKSEKE